MIRPSLRTWCICLWALVMLVATSRFLTTNSSTRIVFQEAISLYNQTASIHGNDNRIDDWTWEQWVKVEYLRRIKTMYNNWEEKKQDDVLESYQRAFKQDDSKVWQLFQHTARMDMNFLHKVGGNKGMYIEFISSTQLRICKVNVVRIFFGNETKKQCSKVFPSVFK